MKTKTDDTRPKPRLALAIATGLGTGYAPVAPGTFGSLLGVAITWLLWAMIASSLRDSSTSIESAGVMAVIATIIAISSAGVWASDQTARYLRKKDPQIVVVDEIAGQLIAYL